MTSYARGSALNAMELIKMGELEGAINLLRCALRETNHPRAKSKLMLAIRELKRAIN